MAGEKMVKFMCTSDDFRLLKRMAAVDDRKMSSLMRRLIRTEAAKRGFFIPTAVGEVKR